MFGGKRPTEKIALTLFTTALLEEIHLSLILDTFGYYSFAQAGAQGDNGGDDDTIASANRLLDC